MELGVYTFVEHTPISTTNEWISPQQRISDLLEEIQQADEWGLDVYAIGEHHRKEYLASAPPVLLSAAASTTKNIRLSSSVTVLGSEDPVRVFQQFSTLDLISKGRAEIMVGRGSFIESFPLFGYELTNYEELFNEKLDLLLQLKEETEVHWKGKYRAPINGREVYPRPVQTKLPIWRAVGGTPESAYATGAKGLPMALAIIGGQPARFKPMAEIHARGAKDAGLPTPRLSINSHGFIADTREEAFEIAFPAFKRTMDSIGRERGWPPLTKAQFEASCGLYGANFVGSPQDIIDKIRYQHSIFGHDRFLLQMSVGSVPHKAMLRSIELLAKEVAPVIQDELVSVVSE